MAEPTIACPSCGAEIRLTESLAAPLVAATRRDYEARLAAERRKIAEEGERLRAAREALDAEVAARAEAMRVTLAREATEKARQAASGEIEAQAARVAELTETLKAREDRLKEAQAAQAEALRQARALEDQRRELDLTVEKRVGEALAGVRDRARVEAETALKLKLTERDEQIAAMQRQIEALRQRAEQGSQQLQGEALELALEAELRARFPHDAIEPVPKGESGADVIQRVRGPGGQECGAILWETKRTKNWSDNWLAKLRADQRAIGADLALLVSRALPQAVERFAPLDGVWVSDQETALALSVALRQALIDLHFAKAAREGQGSKMEMVYDYLTGPRFRHRVEAIVERFSEMRTDLDRERKAMTRLWAKREMQIQGVVEATVGMYGDLQGIAGSALGEIEGLDLPLLDPPEADEA